MNFVKRFFQAAAEGIDAAKKSVDKPKLTVRDDARSNFLAHDASLAIIRDKEGKPLNPFKRPSVAPGVLPSGSKLAMDDGSSGLYQYGALQSIFAEGVGFMGFPELGALTQRIEYRRPAEVLAKEMTRAWIKLQATGEEDKTDRIHELETEMKRLGVQEAFCKATEQDGFFGRSQIFIDMGDDYTSAELKTPLAESVYKVSPNKKIKNLTVIEPIWTYPNQYNATNPLAHDYFVPETWFAMGTEVHSSRFLTFTSRQVPDLLKPAYAFSGLSLTQILVPYVNNWLRTRQSVSDIIQSFSVFVLKTDMSGLLNAGAGVQEANRLQLFSTIKNNQGLMVLNKETEELANISVPLGSLDHLQAQAQEHMSAAVGIPLVILLGITPSGLNASSAGDLKVFYSWIAAQQQHLYTPLLSRLINFLQLSLWGEIDPHIGFKFEPLWALNEEEIVNTRKAEAETDVMLIQNGVIAPEEARNRLANQMSSAYHGLDVNAVPEMPEQEQGIGESDEGSDDNAEAD